MGIKCDQDPLAVGQSNNLNKIVNVYFVYNYMIGQIILLTISDFKIAYLEQQV